MNSSNTKTKFSVLRSMLLAALFLCLFSATALAATFTETEPNNTSDTANVMKAGDTVVASIQENYGDDYFRITPDSNGKLSIKFLHNYEDNEDNDSQWTITTSCYDGNTSHELSQTRVALRDNESIELPFIGVKAGKDYFIHVHGTSSNNTDKQYRIQTAFTASSYYERENNESPSAATKLTAGHTYTGVIDKGPYYDESSDIDYYEFVASSNGKLSLNFLHTFMDNGDEWTNWEIEVLRYTNGQYITLSTTLVKLGSSENVTLPFVGAVADGTYYIKVFSTWGHDIVGSPYQLKVGFTASSYYEKELNESFAQANEITLGKTYSATLGSSSDYDYYKFVPSANGKVSITFKHTFQDKYNGWNVIVYRYKNGNYTELENEYIFLRDSESYALPFIGAVKDATYYIKVDRNYSSNLYGMTYKLATTLTSSSLYEKEMNNSYADANTIKANKTYTGVCNSNGDKDYFKFVAPASGSMVLALTFNQRYVDYWNDDYGWNVYIHKYANGSYTQLAYQKLDLRSGKVTFASVPVTAGKTYYIHVDHSWGVVGYNYTLSAAFTLPVVKHLTATAGQTYVALDWDKNGTASGYQVQRKSGSSYKTVKTVTGTYAKITGLSRRTTYNFRVRSYRTISGVKYYGAWKSIKKTTR